MQQAIVTTYEGVQIAYQEITDRWVFELRGRERSAETLSKAKEIIDKPAPKNKKPFDRFKAFKLSYSGDHAIVEVTSVAEPSGWSKSDYLWIVDKTGNRSKCSADDLAAVTAESQAKVAQLETLLGEIKTLEESARAIVRSIPRVKVEKEDAA